VLLSKHLYKCVYIKRHFCIDPMTILVSHLYNKIAPMVTTDC